MEHAFHVVTPEVSHAPMSSLKAESNPTENASMDVTPDTSPSKYGRTSSRQRLASGAPRRTAVLMLLSVMT